ncbi:helix-turn-helix transcriptional regulator [Paraburkholderia caballeronis]|uniref:helix-turn-helix transcriptional regulator n=1 Tax=Paraburkholderia caballeronis TaxID=416943 RepID=UPI001066A15E|nr:YafY family protein [Paraburkholderia caballeronis]TDV05516.1 putative DNA-binding transcriptional regulator YafY [Paraburkholderia caballeronis]TDV09143.1 putative DNA-binding transcriptional regulator YafY [Paraburkholderia caballeronis]TDV20263.1 putative DNA-binding transcriptional regulator YafY [Paraburkholderia caballeronis]
MSRSGRLLSLMEILRTKRRPVTAAQLAAELSVSERTVYRDVAELAAQGVPVEGGAGVGYVLKPGHFLPPLMFSRDELEAIVLGLRYVDQRGDDVLKTAAAAALTKIAAVLPPQAGATLDAPLAMPGPPAPSFPDNVVELARLRDAIRAQRRLEIVYADAAGRRSRRVVWPVQIGFMDSARVLAAWCELREAFRTFRTDRILAATEGARYPARRADLLRGLHEQLALSARAPAADRN